ncbi:MAG: ferredoxin family protein [Deferrisomatales bacterium]
MGQNRAKKPPTVEDRLAVDETRPDRLSHLDVPDPEACRQCPDKPCTRVCPAETYQWSDEGACIRVRFENCLECGACRLVCPCANIVWRYPMGGMGICYRYG